MTKTDFLVIGGGIAGISAAAELSHQGSVRLLETEAHAAHHTSGRSAALYEPFYGPPPIVELSLASGEDLAAREVLSPRGVLLVAGAGQEDEFACESVDMRMTEITPDEAAEAFGTLDPAKVKRVALGALAQDIDTDRLLQGYLREARANGAQIEFSAPVTAIRRAGGHFQVETPKGAYSASTIINAAGAWADQIAAMAGLKPLGIIPHRRSIARIAAPAGFDVSDWPMLLGVGESFYAKPDAGALIVSPADAEPTTAHDAWADDMVLAEGIARYEAVSRYPVERMIANWAGLRSFARDGAPVYGRDPAEPAFIWFAGQGGYGFQSSVAAAKFIANVATGQAVDAALARAIDPARFG